MRRMPYIMPYVKHRLRRPVAHRLIAERRCARKGESRRATARNVITAFVSPNCRDTKAGSRPGAIRMLATYGAAHEGDPFQPGAAAALARPRPVMVRWPIVWPDVALNTRSQCAEKGDDARIAFSSRAGCDIRITSRLAANVLSATRSPVAAELISER